MQNKFYETIKEYYDFIFPLNNVQVEFVESEFESKDSKLIEIGCANGKLTNALSDYNIRGIDLEQSFIDIAKDRYPKIQFDAINMLDIIEMDETFDGIICLGNTLVHLEIDEIRDFILKSYSMLNRGGKLLIQILNYDNILDNEISVLPLIDNVVVKFDRKYEFGNRIKFITDLTIKQRSETISNSIYLTPIRKDKLIEMLNDAGFINIKTYGSFKKTELKSESLPLIFVCERN